MRPRKKSSKITGGDIGDAPGYRGPSAIAGILLKLSHGVAE
jgi:hypothetical protein